MQTFDPSNFNCLYPFDFPTKKWMIESYLGLGNFSSVYLIKNEKQNYALKCFKSNIQAQIEFNNYKRIKRDIPNYTYFLPEIMFYFKYIPPKRSKYEGFLILEFLKGKTLEIDGTQIKDGYFEVKNTKQLYIIMKKILDIIKVFHDYKFVLNDLKGSNIIVISLDPIELKFIDVGMIENFGKYGSKSDSQSKGTCRYAPPESFERIVSNDKKDIWSFGMMMYFLTTRDYETPDDLILIEKMDDSFIFYFNKQCAEEILNQMILNLKKCLNGDIHGELILEIIDKSLNLDYKMRPSVDNLLKITHSIKNT